MEDKLGMFPPRLSSESPSSNVDIPWRCFLMMMRQRETFAARRFLFWWSREARKDLAKGYERLQKLRDDMDVGTSAIQNMELAHLTDYRR